MSYNDHVTNTPRRRLRSTSVQLGAVTALALSLSACNFGDDDCGRKTAAGPTQSVGAASVATAAGATARTGQEIGALPDRAGFGTHLASCGG